MICPFRSQYNCSYSRAVCYLSFPARNQPLVASTTMDDIIDGRDGFVGYVRSARSERRDKSTGYVKDVRSGRRDRSVGYVRAEGR
ncbi:unnamed protein product [Onchocerca flexuosa]|uniref:RRM domain-containing protein n=1 Tax=Onchocerca flexuosa TaxID=387005 RepID=A0A183HJ01_9BILA|nr:unnamed protein product [Onchocerca flexuosa]